MEGWKGLRMAKGFCAVLCEFFGLQERLRITVDIDHVPGSPNDVADAPNRDANPSDLGFLPSPAFHLVCAELSAPLQLQLFPSADFFRGYFASCDICRCLKVLGAVPLSGQASGLTPFGPTAPFHLEPVSDRTFRYLTESVSKPDFSAMALKQCAFTKLRVYKPLSA